MRLPGYSDEENEFYVRAEVNYTRDKNDSPGEWPKHPQNGFAVGFVSDVIIRQDGEVIASQKKYHSAQVADIVQQGRDRPRQLDEDAPKANAARRDYREQASWFEAWAVRENGAKRYAPLSNVSTEYVPV
jgi:hypothetical protein